MPQRLVPNRYLNNSCKTIQQAQAQQVIDAPSDVAVDATGLETHHASRYYINGRAASAKVSMLGSSYYWRTI